MAIIESALAKRRAISEERLKICDQCEHFDKSTTKCKKCGCFMFAKTMFMSAYCPIGKWGKHESE